MAFKNPELFKASLEGEAKQSLENTKTIAVEGVIGVGKTTLTRLLANRWKAEICLEEFETNPFLTGGFYKDTAEKAFNTEIFFLLSRFRQQQKMAPASSVLLTDYVFDKNLIFAEMNLSAEDMQIYKSVYDRFSAETPAPDLVVLLQADLETLMRRIYFRDREFERSISPAYIEKLMNAYYRYFSAYSKAPVLTIQTSGLDFVNDVEDFQKVCTLIEARLNGEVQLSLSPRSSSAERVVYAPII